MLDIKYFKGLSCFKDTKKLCNFIIKKTIKADFCSLSCLHMLTYTLHRADTHVIVYRLVPC